MIDFLLFVGGLFALVLILGRLRAVERQVAALEDALARAERRLAARPADAPPAGASVPAAPPPVAEPLAVAPPAPARAHPVRPIPRLRVPAVPRMSLEDLIGGRLPIWIGGAALVLAGVFLVRYSIESGLIGPGARTLLAALFALALVVASEAAVRVPALRADPRVGQVLAGAGVASAYGTLYMAAALYHLIPPLPAFATMLVVTAGALVLALRHGPPTAVMALVGGFAAPLVAGFDVAGIGPLLVYLGLFIAAIFGLAIRRDWAWLALAATAAGLGWVNFLIVAFPGAQLAGVGLFAVLLSAGASAALPATGARAPWLRLTPLVAGCIQLVLLAPALDFDALAWSFYLVLAAAALVLGWRDRAFLPGALAALPLLLLLEGLAFVAPDAAPLPTIVAAIVATALFAIPGHLRAGSGRDWAALAIGGTAGPLLVANAAAPELLSREVWGLLALAATGALATLAIRLRDAEDRTSLVGATAAAGLLGVVGLAQLLPPDGIALAFVLVAAALAFWARARAVPALFVLPALPLAAAFVAAALPLMRLFILVAQSTGGAALTYPMLPPVGEVLRMLALPALLAVGLLYDRRQYGRFRAPMAGASIAVAILVLYALAKQPLAIATPSAFESLGFVERALLTQCCLATGWALIRYGNAARLGRALIVLGLARFVWFDLLIFNPALVPQAVGGLPLFNAAVLHPAVAALWLHLLPGERGAARGTRLLLLVAILAAVRQAAQGSILTGPVTTLENIGYSAALLALGIFWLTRGIASGARELRIAGLALLTIVTFKVFLIDAAALDGVLRILSFLGLGVALIGIGWAYGRFLGRDAAAARPAPAEGAEAPAGES